MLAVAFVAFVLWRSAALLALLYVAVMVAVVLDRPVASLARRGLPRAWALALVLTVIGSIAFAAFVVALGPLVDQARALATAAPELADRLRTAVVDRLEVALEGTPVAGSVRGALSDGASALAHGLYGAAGEVANAAGALATALVFAVVLLVSGPHLVHRAIGALPARRRAWAEGLARDLSISLGGYLSGLGIIVLARVLATGMFLVPARVPFVIPLTLLAGASVLVPYVGAILRLVSIGAVAWATRGSGTAIAALAFVAAYDVAENYVVSPLVYRRTLGVSALGQLVAVLFLGYHFGVVGAVLAIPLAATAQIVVRALRAPAGEVTASADRPGAERDPASTAKAFGPR